MAKRPENLILYCEREMRITYGYKVSASSFNTLKPAYQREYLEFRKLPRKILRKILINSVSWILKYIPVIEDAGDTAKTFEDIAEGISWVEKGKLLARKIVVVAELLIGEGCVDPDSLPNTNQMIEAKRRTWINQLTKFALKTFSQVSEVFTKKTDALYLKLDKIRRADPAYQEAERIRRAEYMANQRNFMTEKQLIEHDKVLDQQKIQELKERFTELSGREATHEQARSLLDPDWFNPDDLVSIAAELTCWREVISELEYNIKYKGWILKPDGMP